MTTQIESPALDEDFYHSPLCRNYLEILSQIFGDKPKAQIRVADLGCYDGRFAAAFARAGYQVLGIEAKPANYEKCLQAQAHWQFPNLSFVLEDARQLEWHGPFDAVFCSGLLYHLDYPGAFLNLLGRVTKRLLILNTHYAPPQQAGWISRLITAWKHAINHRAAWWQACRKKLPHALEQKIQQTVRADALAFYRLGNWTRHEGYLGRWYPEFHEPLTQTQKNQQTRNAFDNDRSFWLHKQEIMAVLHAAGFAEVREQDDPWHNRGQDASVTCRAIFMGLKGER